MSDIDTAVVDSLKVLDPNRPIREADIVHMIRKRKGRLIGGLMACLSLNGYRSMNSQQFRDGRRIASAKAAFGSD